MNTELTQADAKQAIKHITKLYTDNNFATAVPLLPLLFRLKDSPFTLENHFPMEPMYKLQDVPPNLILKCGRQVSKSTTLSVQGILRSAIYPHLNTLFVAPLFEQIRRFSNNFVRPMIMDSPIRDALIGSGVHKKDNSVFQRTLVNGSNMFFTFAFLDAERARGIPGDLAAFDEIQDIDETFLPVIESCLDASDLAITQYSGTPKTTNNPIHRRFLSSSQAEWVMQCDSCNKYNMACLDEGLDKMITEKGFCCIHCKALLNPRNGFWYHLYADRANFFPGYHIPQPILPMHCQNKEKWHRLFLKKKEWPQYRYYNEVLGESCDVGTSLISQTQLKKISVLPWDVDDLDAAVKNRSKYARVILGVDWGSGAAGNIRRHRNKIIVGEGTESFTVVTAIGVKANGKVDLLYAVRLPTDMEPETEVKHILKLFHKFKAMWIAHDYSGAGFLREAMMIQAGFAKDRIIPFQYTSQPTKPIVNWNSSEGNNSQVRAYHSLDKARSLELLCAVLNAGEIHFPRWKDSTSLIYLDFLSLIQERREGSLGYDRYLIIRNPQQTDDFCHALNFAVAAQWHSAQKYPDLAKKYGVVLSRDELSMYSDNGDWG